MIEIGCIKRDAIKAGVAQPGCGDCPVPDMIIDTFRDKDTAGLSLREQVASVRDVHCPTGLSPDVRFVRLATLQQVSNERARRDLAARIRLHGQGK